MGFWYTDELDAKAKTNLLYKADAEIRRIIAEKDARLEVARKNYDAAIDAARKAREDEEAAARAGDTENRHEATVAIMMAERDLTAAEKELEAAREAAEHPKITEPMFLTIAGEMYKALDAVGSRNAQRIEKIISELEKMKEEEDKIRWEAFTMARALDDLTGRKYGRGNRDPIGFFIEKLNEEVYKDFIGLVNNYTVVYKPGQLVKAWAETEALHNENGGNTSKGSREKA